MAERNISIRLSLRDGETVRRALMTLGADGQKALARIEKASAPASKGLLAVNAATGELRGGMTAFGTRLGAVGTGLMALGPAGLAAAAGVGALAIGLTRAMRAARTAIDELDALDDTAKKLGVGVEALQEWRYAFEQNGVSSQTLEMALQRLGRRMGNIARGESKEVKKAFDELGVSIFRADGSLKTIEEILPEVADGLAGVTEQNKRLAIAQKLFDSEGVAAVTLLQQGAAALERYRREARELGAVMDEHLVAKASETADRLATLERIVDTQLNSALVDLAPVLIGVAEAFAEVARRVADVVDGFREIEDRSSRGLERRIDELTERLSAGRDSFIREAARGRMGMDVEDPGREYDEMFAERERIMAELVRREGERRHRAGGGGVGESAADTAEAERIAKVTDALRFQLEQLERTEYGKRVFQELQKAGIDGDHAEARAIADLVLQVRRKERALEAETNAEKAREQQARKGLQVTEKVRTAEEDLAAALTELNGLREEGAISAETHARAVADAERRRLEASTEAADGIKRALIGLRDESRDTATQWETDINSMNATAREAFIDMAMQIRTVGEALESFLNTLARAALGRVYDRTVGAFVDPLLDTLFPEKHAGGVVGRETQFRRASPLVFLGAPRLHGGGLVPGEVPIIAERGERVLTAAQQEATAATIQGLAAMAKARPDVKIVVTNTAGNVARARAQTSWSGGELRVDVLVEELETRMARNVGRGDGLAPVMERRYGLNPAAGAVR